MKTINLIVNYIADGIIEVTGGTLAEEVDEMPTSETTDKLLEEEIEESIKEDVTSKNKDDKTSDDNVENIDENEEVIVEPIKENQE
jgi:hypothetical protein